MGIASLSMYVSPAPVAAATATFWAFLRDELRRQGLSEVPETLDQALAYDDAWLQPDLLLSQTCGYPYIRRLRDRVRLVATPVYSHEGCDGPNMCSFVIVRQDAPLTAMEDLRGVRAAINSPDSNSGANLFRAAVAPLSREGRFFSTVIETGGHVASIEAVASGTADVAAIDCVTYGNVRRFAPLSLSNIRVLARTPMGPGLPLITRGTASEEMIAALRASLERAVTEPSLAPARATMGLTGFAVLGDADYEPLAVLEREARRLGYPVIA